MAAVVTPTLDAGFTARDFRLKATDGGYYGLDNFRGSSALLVMFICNHCPYVKALIKHLVREVKLLMADCGVGAVAIMPNDTDAYPEDSYDKMAALAQSLAFPFPYVIDEGQSVAKSYGAVCTPDFFVSIGSCSCATGAGLMTLTRTGGFAPMIGVSFSRRCGL